MPPVLARLDASHRGRAADATRAKAASVAKAAPAQSDRHARRLPADRLDSGRRPPPQGDRRLQGVDAGRLSERRIWRRGPPFRCRIRRVNRAYALGAASAAPFNPSAQRFDGSIAVSLLPAAIGGALAAAAPAHAQFGSGFSTIRRRGRRRICRARRCRRSRPPVQRSQAPAAAAGAAPPAPPPPAAIQTQPLSPLPGATLAPGSPPPAAAPRRRPACGAAAGRHPARRSNRPKVATARRHGRDRGADPKNRQRDARSFPGSTRSPGGSSHSMPRSARPCSSARCK